RAALRGVIRRITARRKFGEEGELVRAALRRQLLFGERDRTFGKSRVIGRQYRAVIAQRRAHQIGYDQERSLRSRFCAHLIPSFGHYFGGSRSIKPRRLVHRKLIAGRNTCRRDTISMPAEL